MKIYSASHMQNESTIENNLYMFKSYEELKIWYLETLRSDLEFLKGVDTWEEIEHILDVSTNLSFFLNGEYFEVSLSPSNYNIYNVNSYGIFETEVKIKSIEV